MKRWGLIAIVLMVGLGLFTSPAFAKDLTEKDIPGSYDDVFDTADFETAGGPDTFTVTGKEIVLIWNKSSADTQVTLNSVADNLGRTNDLTDTVPANSIVMVGPMQREGWEIASGSNRGTIQITYPDGTSNIEVAIIRVAKPDG